MRNIAFAFAFFGVIAGCIGQNPDLITPFDSGIDAIDMAEYKILPCPPTEEVCFVRKWSDGISQMVSDFCSVDCHGGTTGRQNILPDLYGEVASSSAKAIVLYHAFGFGVQAPGDPLPHCDMPPKNYAHVPTLDQRILMQQWFQCGDP